MKSEIMNYKEEIELIYSEAQILLNEIFTSYRKVTDKSYVVVSFIFSIQAFACSNLINKENIQLNTMILITFLIPLLFIMPNIFPRKMIFPGSKPSDMYKIQEHIKVTNGNNEIDLLKYRIEDIQVAIMTNSSELENSNKRLSRSIVASFLSLLLFVLFWLSIAIA